VYDGHLPDSSHYKQNLPPQSSAAAAAAAAAGSVYAGQKTVADTGRLQPARTTSGLAVQQENWMGSSAPAAAKCEELYSQCSSLHPTAAYASSCTGKLQCNLMQQQLVKPTACAIGAADAATNAACDVNLSQLLASVNGLPCVPPAVAAAGAAARDTAALTAQCGGGSSSGSNSSSSKDLQFAGMLGIDELKLPEEALTLRQPSVIPAAAATTAAAAAAVAAEPPTKKHKAALDSCACTISEGHTATEITAAAAAAAGGNDKFSVQPASTAWPEISTLLQRLSAAVSQQQQQQIPKVHSSSTAQRFSSSVGSRDGSPAETYAAVQEERKPVITATGSCYKNGMQQLCGGSSSSSFNSSATTAAGQLLPLFQAAPKSQAGNARSSTAGGSAAAAAGRSPSSVNSAAGTMAAAAAATEASTFSSCPVADVQQQREHLQQLLLPLAFPPFSSSRSLATAPGATHSSSPLSAAAQVLRVAQQQSVEQVQLQQQLQGDQAQQQQQQQHAFGTDEWSAVFGLLMLADRGLAKQQRHRPGM
jgi:hypothetical protein